MPKREEPHVHYESCRGIRDPLSRTKRASCHRTAWHTTRCREGGAKRKTQPSPVLIGCIHQATLTELWQRWGFYCFQPWSSVLSEHRAVIHFHNPPQSNVGWLTTRKTTADGFHKQRQLTRGLSLCDLRVARSASKVQCACLSCLPSWTAKCGWQQHGKEQCKWELHFIIYTRDL